MVLYHWSRRAARDWHSQRPGHSPEKEETTVTKTTRYTLTNEREEQDQGGSIYRVQTIIPTSDIQQVVVLDGRYIEALGLPCTQATIAMLDADPVLAATSDVDEIIERLQELGYDGRRCDDYEAPRETIVIDAYAGAFDLSSADTYSMYEYHDGSNLRQIWLDPESAIEVVVEDAYVQWYRREWEFGRIYKIISIDGEAVEGKHLAYEDSQYPGSLPWGRIVDEDERRKLLGIPEEITTAEAARRLGVSVQRVRQLCAAGRLGRKHGRDWIISAADLDGLDTRPGRPREDADGWHRVAGYECYIEDGLVRRCKIGEGNGQRTAYPYRRTGIGQYTNVAPCKPGTLRAGLRRGAYIIQ